MIEQIIAWTIIAAFIPFATYIFGQEKKYNFWQHCLASYVAVLVVFWLIGICFALAWAVTVVFK